MAIVTRATMAVAALLLLLLSVTTSGMASSTSGSSNTETCATPLPHFQLMTNCSGVCSGSGACVVYPPSSDDTAAECTKDYTTNCFDHDSCGVVECTYPQSSPDATWMLVFTDDAATYGDPLRAFLDLDGTPAFSIFNATVVADVAMLDVPEDIQWLYVCSVFSCNALCGLGLIL